MSEQTNGQETLSLQQLKNILFPKESFEEKVDNFVTENLKTIKAGKDLPIPLPNIAKIVLLVIPISAFDKNRTIDLELVSKEVALLDPISNWSNYHRFNSKGYFSASYPRDNEFDSYTQIYRSGVIEAVDTSIVDDPAKMIPSYVFEEKLILALTRYTKLLGKLNLGTPAGVFLNLLSVRNYRFGLTPRNGEAPKTIDADDLTLPKVEIGEDNLDASKILRSSFDIVWNAGGWPRSQNYDANTGEWKRS